VPPRWVDFRPESAKGEGEERRLTVKYLRRRGRREDLVLTDRWTMWGVRGTYQNEKRAKKKPRPNIREKEHKRSRRVSTTVSVLRRSSGAAEITSAEVKTRKQTEPGEGGARRERTGGETNLKERLSAPSLFGPARTGGAVKKGLEPFWDWRGPGRLGGREKEFTKKGEANAKKTPTFSMRYRRARLWPRTERRLDLL